MSDEPTFLKTINLYAFHILLEAKARAMVIECKKYHPDWTKQTIKDALANLVEIAYDKDGLKDAVV